MRLAPIAAVVLVALAGCGDDDDAARTVTVERTVTTAAPPAEGPTASVPEPDGPLPSRCAVQSLDVPGLVNLVADGVDCGEAESVLLNWLQGCAGEEEACEPVPGYRCEQERFAGSRSDVECAKGAAAVRFSFD